MRTDFLFFREHRVRAYIALLTSPVRPSRDRPNTCIILAPDCALVLNRTKGNCANCRSPGMDILMLSERS